MRQPARPMASTSTSRRRLVDGADLGDAVVGAVERGGGGDLDGGEGAVVEVGLDPGQRVDQPGVADGETHAPAGHGVGLGQRGELDRDVAGAVDLEDRGGRIAVEVDLGVGEVGEHPEVVLLREGDQLAVEVEVADLRGGVRREGDHDGHGLRHRVGHGAVERAQVFLGIEPSVVERGDVAEHAAGDHEAVGVDRVGGVGDEHDVAGCGDRHGEVGEALLGAEGGDDLGLGVELHPEAAGVVAGLGAAEAGDALGRRNSGGSAGLRTVSTSFSTIWLGVSMSGLPMPKSMMSMPSAR